MNNLVKKGNIDCRSIMILVFMLFSTCVFGQFDFEIHQAQIPVLTGKEFNPVLKIIPWKSVFGQSLKEIKIRLQGTTNLNDVESVSLFYSASSNQNTFVADQQIGSALLPEAEITFVNQFVIPDKGFFWISVQLKNKVDLLHRIQVSCNQIETSKGIAIVNQANLPQSLRIGIALRQHNEDNVHTYRIPGLTTTSKGTLLAVYDVRRDSSRDLQGNIDIGLSRSADGGNTWEPMKIILDRGNWGGLPQKYNGISDPCILADTNTGTIYVAALWMHGVLDDNGKWIDGICDTSKEWNHQWREKGSQPGWSEKQTAQFLLTKSTDDGIIWSEPINLTTMCKRPEWWLFAPAPGHGIVLNNGVLVFPTQGRDSLGKSFSNLMYSSNHGKSWKVSNPASTGTTENMAVQLDDGSVMLNMRDGSNRKDTTSINGRNIAVTTNLGKTWTEHSSSHYALIEPVCMASIHKHSYVQNGIPKSILLFSNPNSKTERKKMTIKVSFDNGKTWPKEHQILLDEFNGRGYSCLTSVDENTIGILYESSQADLVFQKITLAELVTE